MNKNYARLFVTGSLALGLLAKATVVDAYTVVINAKLPNGSVYLDVNAGIIPDVGAPQTRSDIFDGLDTVRFQFDVPDGLGTDRGSWSVDVPNPLCAAHSEGTYDLRGASTTAVNVELRCTGTPKN